MYAIKDVDGRLSWCEVDLRLPGPLEICIKVSATAVNRADLAQRAGLYPPPAGASSILGLECSGVVEAVGDGVSWPPVGEEVCALLSGGGYAQKVVLPAAHALPIPEGLSLIEAAAVPEVFTTAWLNLKREGELKAGERVLVHAAASGVGTAALQLCRAWGNPAFATVGSSSKEKYCLKLGAEACVNRKDGSWLTKVRQWGRVNVILDPVGASYLEDNLAVLAVGGRLVNIGLLGGAEAKISLGRLLVKRLTLKGSVLRSRSVEEKADLLQALKREVWPLFASRKIQPIIFKTFSIEEAEEAHRLLLSDETIGKVLMLVPS